MDETDALQAVEAIRPLVPAETMLAQFALHWTLVFDAVTIAIPGAKNPRQATENAQASDLPPIPGSTLARLGDIYDAGIRAQVHLRW